jgi:hypothetical protein
MKGDFVPGDWRDWEAMTPKQHKAAIKKELRLTEKLEKQKRGKNK